ncbi:hypothetical protein J6590_030522 [Homalodisca vitripennis]|nr:hypothetical protein J6590_030522 [Homalodisca vitripennis]
MEYRRSTEGRKRVAEGEGVFISVSALDILQPPNHAKVIDLKNNDLDCSLHDIAELSARLESERNRRKLELDQRLTEQDVVEEEKAELIQTIFDLKSKFNSTWLAQDFDLIRASTENEGSSISNNVQTKSDCKIVLRREGPRDWTIVKRSSYGSRSNHCNTSKCKGSPDLHRVGSEHADGNQLTRETSTVKSLRLFTDSHGRSVSHIWLKTFERSVRITAHVMPGARMCDVLNAAGPELNVAGQDDCIAILAGTNDISNNGCADITEQIEALCRGASGTNILIVGIPLRFDNTDLNEQISLVNHAIGIICSNYTNVNFISLDSLRRANYTRHGLHLNLGGKRVLCNLLYDSLRYPVFSQPSPLSKKSNLCINQKFPSSESFYEETTQTGSNSDVCQRIPILITDRSLSRKRSSTVSSIPARRSAVDVASFVYSGTVTDKTIFLEQNRICGKVP